ERLSPRLVDLAHEEIPGLRADARERVQQVFKVRSAFRGERTVEQAEAQQDLGRLPEVRRAAHDYVKDLWIVSLEISRDALDAGLGPTIVELLVHALGGGRDYAGEPLHRASDLSAFETD